VLVAAEHHADDYILVERMANSLRDWVKDHALAHKYNLLYDGSGIVYPNRYDKIVAEAKAKNFRTRLCAVDAPMEQVIPRVIARKQKTGRTLPWTVATGKHTDLPFSLFPGIDDLKVDKVLLFGNDTDEHKKGRWLVAESFKLFDEEVSGLLAARKEGRLAQEFRQLIDDEAKGATLPLLKKVETPEDMVRRYPEIHDDNVSFFIHPKDKNRVFVIYDVERLTELVKKGQMNKQAASLAGLTIPTEESRFLVSNIGSGPSR
jgi:Zeta toxin